MDYQSINEDLAQAFDQLSIQFKRDRYRGRAYKNAAEALRNHPGEIESGAQAQQDIRGIGKSIASKIDEMIRTGKLSLINDRKPEEVEKERVTKIFEGIFAVGPSTSEKWYNQGYRNLKDLEKIYVTFTDAQKLGYYYYNHLNERIPRSEMDQIKNILNNIMVRLNLDYEICGSYRRGEPDSGDIDCLIKGGKEGFNGLSLLITELVNLGIIVGHLAIGSYKYMGILRLTKESCARRIDLMIIDPESWPYATLYFTGSKKLNIMMRTKALDLGYSMNEYGMVDHRGTPYLAKTERDIFDRLQMEYLEPTQRSIGRK